MLRSACAFLFALHLAGMASAQSLHKCVDARGRISYIGQECEAAGLKSAGEIRDNLNVTPAYQPPPAPPAPKAAAKPAAPKPEAAAAASKDAVAPKEPERRCFVVKTAKGPVTRCNEVPAEDDKPAQ